MTWRMRILMLAALASFAMSARAQDTTPAAPPMESAAPAPDTDSGDSVLPPPAAPLVTDAPKAGKAPAAPKPSEPKPSAPQPAQATPPTPAASMDSPAPEPKSSPSPATVPTPGLPALPAPPPAPAAAPDDPDATPIARFRSLLFSVSDMNKIYSSAQTYKSNLARARELARRPGLANAPNLADRALQATQLAPGKEQTVEHPQFYLSLIAYDSPGNWSVWVNKQKFTPETMQLGELTLREVQKSHARFLWKPRMFTVYEDRASKEGSTANIRIIKEEEAVEFVLYPNQSFSSFTMGIVEGYLPPVKIEVFNTNVSVTSDDKKPGAPGAADAPPPAGPGVVKPALSAGSSPDKK